jgi:hypothetical protein
MTPINPFAERGRITIPERFAGRWSELSLIFERLEAGRPVLISGGAAIGKSSLLTHITQSAAVNLEIPELRAYYLDLRGAESASQVYATVAGALGQRGDTLAALELGLVAAGDPVLLCLDNAQAALAAGWGEGLLEALARVARGNNLLLVVAMAAEPPLLSERFATIKLGALAQTEVRLLIATYLDGTGVGFTGQELREIAELSGAHPAYVQRAAYHLFQSKIDPLVDWRAAYRDDVRTRPIPGATLPPAVFQGDDSQRLTQSSYTDGEDQRSRQIPQQLPLPDIAPLLTLLIALASVVVLFFLTGSWLFAIIAGLAALIGASLWQRQKRR